MISAATTKHLVGRLHVDLGRTRSMICLAWPTAWTLRTLTGAAPSTQPGARSPAASDIVVASTW